MSCANCSAGYYCNSSAAVSPFQNMCAAGQYSLDGATTCTACAPGLYGAVAAMNSTSCSGPCAANYFGASAGLATSSCSGHCSPGYYCTAGSTVATQFPCPPGFACSGATGPTLCPPGWYSLVGAVNCTKCPGGVYGVVGDVLTNASCSGPCPAGYACPNGSSNATMLMCLSGSYAAGSATACSLCPLGSYR